MQRHVLTMLALRMNWATGRGYASTRQLDGDADVEERTVRRATKWARDTGFLIRARRGHYISKETAIASEWCLTLPGYPQAESQPDTGDLLGKPTGLNGEANRTAGEANRTAAHHHQESVFLQDLSPSSDLIKIVIEEIENTTGRTIGPQWAERTVRLLLNGHGAANPAGYIRASIRAEPDPKTRFLSLYDNRDQA
jgi:hypothetical protein